MLVESSLCRFDIISLRFDEDNKLRADEKIQRDSLRGEELGYRCQACRYPDANGANQYGWPNLESIVQAGAISWRGCRAREEHKCMLCQPDGTLTPLIVAVDHPGQLSLEDRELIIQREQQEQAILLCQSDAGIKSFDCKSWSSVKRHHIHNIHMGE